jgi:hypothetical protein
LQLNDLGEGIVSWFHWAGDEEEPWRRLIKGRPVEAVDEDSGELVDIKPTQDDPNDVEGLLIGFRYTDAVGNKSKRFVLCRRCWFVHGDMYVQGFCTLRKALRTFRIDQMTNVEEMRTERRIPNPLEYFARYADHEDEANYISERTGFRVPVVSQTGSNAPANPRTVSITPRQVVNWTVQKQRELRAREACLNGMRVLAYLVLADDVVTDEEVNIQQSYVEARLAMCGFDHDERMVAEMMAITRVLTVPSRSFTRALNAVSEDRAHLKLILDAASCVAETMPVLDGTERKALQEILDRAKRVSA